ncbi:MAG: hypothetical protein ACK42L_00095 [Thermoanaerobaculum sp.]
MTVAEKVREVIQQLILPELDSMRHQLVELRTAVDLTNRRLDDVNVHLADQSRRMDALREELTLRIDETNTRVDAVREELLGEVRTLRSELTARIDETNKRVDALREDLTLRIDETNKRVDAVREDLTFRIDETNRRMDRVYDGLQNLALAVARREDQERLERRVGDLEKEVLALKQKVA